MAIHLHIHNTVFWSLYFELKSKSFQRFSSFLTQSILITIKSIGIHLLSSYYLVFKEAYRNVLHNFFYDRLNHLFQLEYKSVKFSLHKIIPQQLKKQSVP